MSTLIALCAGLLFGLGLLLSGMADPLKVKGFLDLLGPWNPTLALVMGGALVVGMVGFRRAAARRTAWSGEPMQLPPPGPIDGRLVLGGVLFGIGWGLAGYCPGPAIVAAGSGSWAALAFVAAMVAGMLLHDRVFAAAQRHASAEPVAQGDA
jgi:uncharacterized membrane protein YedE/YeeE